MEFKSQDKSIGNILFEAGSLFQIPRYQRPYAWEEDQISEFWSDVNESDDSYFFGTIILNNESLKENENRKEIIDGQQRILTITILAAVLRDWANSLKDKSTAESIQRDCISVKGFLGDTQEYRVLCGESTSKYFEENIQNDKSEIFLNDSSPKRKEHKRIYRNYRYLKEQVEKILENIPSTENKIKEIKKILHKINSLRVVLIEIQSGGDAYEIFETVNAKGEPLGPVDMIKNLVLSHLRKEGDKVDKSKETWSHIEDIVGDEMPKLLRYYWLSKYSFSTNKRLYKTIKKEFKKEKSKYSEFLNELEETSKIYKKILDADEEDFPESKYAKYISSSLRAMNDAMNVSQCYPFLISLLRNSDCNNREVRKIFKDIEKFSFLYFAISKLPSNTIYTLFSDYGILLEKEVQRAKTKKDKEKKIMEIGDKLIEKLRKLKPSKDTFIEKFIELKYAGNSTKIIRYTLSVIEDNKSNFSEFSINFPEVNIEHIYPQDPAEGFNDNKDLKWMVNNIGNLTLLSKKLNSKAANKKPHDKLKEFKESEIIMTKEIVKILEKNKDWGVKEIEKRARKLGEEAYKIFNF